MYISRYAMFLVCAVDGYVLLVVLIFLDAYLSYKKFETVKILFRELIWDMFEDSEGVVTQFWATHSELDSHPSNVSLL